MDVQHIVLHSICASAVSVQLACDFLRQQFITQPRSAAASRTCSVRWGKALKKKKIRVERQGCKRRGREDGKLFLSVKLNFLAGQASPFVNVWSGRFWFHQTNVYHIAIKYLGCFYILHRLVRWRAAVWHQHVEKSLVCLLQFPHFPAALASLCTSPTNSVSAAVSLHWFSLFVGSLWKPSVIGMKTLLWHRTRTEPRSSLIRTKTASFGWDQGSVVGDWPGPKVCFTPVILVPIKLWKSEQTTSVRKHPEYK